MINLKPATKRDTEIQLVSYPAWGFPTETGDWRIHLSGVAWMSPVVLTRPPKQMISILGQRMKDSPEEMASEVFNDRVTPFMAEAGNRRHVTATIGDQEFALKRRTRRNGHFRNWLTVPAELVKKYETSGQGGVQSILPISLSVSDTDCASVEVNARLLPHRGTSVISDIDDTVKDSSVGDRRELLVNTFIRDFKCVEGMAETYRVWAEQGVEFHYVSSSPWQLFQPLMELKHNFELPLGTMHLRNFRLRDQLFKKFIIRRQGKRLAIQKLLKCYPQRDFILIGDSGEKDPEIYLKICKRNPGRIKGLFIRDLKHRPMDEDLQQSIRRAMNGSPFSRFTSGQDLADKYNALIGS